MHAYLLISPSAESIVDLSNKLNAKVLEFPLAKIEDTRNLNNFLRLTINEKTLVLIKDIQNATKEALSAFLKNLEEPQENIYFALTSNNTASILPTIVSRCEIVKSQITTYRFSDKSKIEKFLNSNTKERLLEIDKIKERIDAINFVQDLIYFDYERSNFQFQEAYLKTLKNLKANGNVSLQIANLAVLLSSRSSF